MRSNGLKVGPVYVNGVKMLESGEIGPPLYIHPADDGVQHCEITATRDYLDAIKPRWLAWLLRNQNYVAKVRSLPKDATVHPSVNRRLELPGVQQTNGFHRYRPDALRGVDAFKRYFEPN